MSNCQKPVPARLAVLSTILGIFICEKLNANQQNVAGNFLEALGQIILLISAEVESNQSSQQSQSSSSQGNNDKKIKDLQKQIDELKEYIEKRG